MKFKGTIIGEASGSLNGLTFSHNRFGQYIRVRAVPVNPSSSFQDIVRGYFTTLATRWSNVLTPAQRLTWTNYAENVLVPDRLGMPHKLTALNWYAAMNSLRLRASVAVLDTAPATFNMAELTPPTIISATASTDVLSIGFTNTDPWAAEVGGFLQVYTGWPQNPSIEFYKGPYRYAGKINGAVIPPTSPLPINAAIAFAVGQKIFVRFRAIRTDGRISPEFRNFGTGV